MMARMHFWWQTAGWIGWLLSGLLLLWAWLRTRGGLPARRRAWWRAFVDAARGVGDLLTTQRHARFHLFAGWLALGAGLLVGLERLEWLLLLLTIGLVISAEAWNSAVEATVDLVTTAQHPLARRAKDIAAGSVLLSALTAVLVGLGLFGAPLLAWLSALAGSGR
jgi:diacylglycerol kinase (ATP)